MPRMSEKYINRRRLLMGCGAVVGIASNTTIGFAQGKSNASTSRKKPGNRIEPLFLSEADARQVINDYCVQYAENPLNPEQITFLISRLQRQLWLTLRKDGGGGLGETRLGGAPDLPKGTPWPIRPVPVDLEQKAKEWNGYHAWVLKQMQHALPFEFIGQVDLAEVARTSTYAEGLPTMGRLLFFWDGALGLLEAGSATCRVIHDQTAEASLERLPIPDQFTTMENWWREPDPKTIAHFKEMVRTLEAAGQKEAAKAMREALRKSEKPDLTATKPFVYPARAMRFESLMALPHRNTVELMQNKELSAFANDDNTSEHYALLTSNDVGPFTSDKSNMRRTQDWLSIQARRSRFMGPPDPEQQDPRFDAVGKANLPPYPWRGDMLTNASRKAAEWQLLLQVPTSILTRKVSEGTIYFMIQKADLARQDFSRVVASYQQT
jgi:hypothetical protein